MLVPKRFLPGINFVLLPIGYPKKSEIKLYEPCDTLVAFTKLMHLSCPSCGIRNTLFHSMKTKPPINGTVM
jgi:hypothetical protein